MQDLGLDTHELDLLKYREDQPRVPAGNGRDSGEWTSGKSISPSQQYAQNDKPASRFPWGKLPEGGGDGGTGRGTSPAPLEAPSSRVLGRALKQAGKIRPVDSAAHHMVAGSAPDAQGARDFLSRYGVGRNDAENGMFLPTQEHAGMHTSKYYDAVNRALEHVGSKEGGIRVLNSIKESVKAGRFPE